VFIRAMIEVPVDRDATELAGVVIHPPDIGLAVVVGVDGLNPQTRPRIVSPGHEGRRPAQDQRGREAAADERRASSHCFNLATATSAILWPGSHTIAAPADRRASGCNSRA